MKNTRKNSKISAESIAKKASRGENISKHFTNKGKMMPAIQRVNVDFTEPMLDELDEVAIELNISRQAVIKTFLRRSLDEHRRAKKEKKLA